MLVLTFKNKAGRDSLNHEVEINRVHSEPSWQRARLKINTKSIFSLASCQGDLECIDVT